MLDKNTNSLLTILMAALISTHLGAIENQKSGQPQFNVRFEARNILYSPRENKKTLVGTLLRGLGYIFAGISPAYAKKSKFDPLYLTGSLILAAGCYIDLKKQSSHEMSPFFLNSASCFFGAFTAGSMIMALAEFNKANGCYGNAIRYGVLTGLTVLVSAGLRQRANYFEQEAEKK